MVTSPVGVTALYETGVVVKVLPLELSVAVWEDEDVSEQNVLSAVDLE